MILPTLNIEKELWQKGYEFVVGLDEAGRGPLAGPMIAGAVIFPKDFDISPVGVLPAKPVSIIRDSKTLSKKQREEAYDWILKNALAVGIGRVEHSEIDELGLTKAEQLAFKRAVSNLTPDFYLIDAFKINDVSPEKQRGIIKGDQKVFTIAAASIIAKVTRDKIMYEFDREFPQYGFKNHVGYGTKTHLDALSKFGPCEIHRRSFKPVLDFVS